MKVGDYVRFDYHRVTVPIQIARITEVHYDITDEDANVCYSTDVGLVISESNLVKESSTNIIDLIEVGDYVNGMKIVDTSSQYYKLVTNLVDNNAKEGLKNVFINNEKDIKSIVTKEMFTNAEYRVETN